MHYVEKQRPGVTFRDGTADVLLWAPKAHQVQLQLAGTDRQLPMAARERGYWHLATDQLQPGAPYRFVLDGNQALPDPASLSQPEGVHGPSAVVDLTAHQWQDEHWINPALSAYILYELHTGTFSGTGDFEGVAARLDYLADLGITAVELMPVAEFPGARNWGYDGVFPYAAHHAYGGPEGLMKLVDACHARGLAVVLDVVYNHMGPEGNYLGAYGPYFTDKYQTPWGGAINFDDAGCDAVREFFVQNALMWFRDFHIDALRMDAVHAIKDFSAQHLLQELRLETDRLMQQTGRQYYLTVECDLNDTRFIRPVAAGGYGMDAQWMDEFHHALRVTAGEARNGYYSDFEGLEHLAKSYRDAYVYDGLYSPHRDKTFGNKADSHPGHQFIVFSQNHDQTGNRMLGERTGSLLSFELQKLLAGAVLVSPFLPLLFMGEEYGETAPFLYFVSHGDEALIKAVREGRKAEFAAFHSEGEAPDPQSEETFARSRLQWALTGQEPHRTMLHYYKALIALRKTQPALSSTDRTDLEVRTIDQQVLLLTRRYKEQLLTCFMNFSDQQQTVQITGHQQHRKLFDSAAVQWRGPQDSAALIRPGAPLTLQPASILIYSNHV